MTTISISPFFYRCLPWLFLLLGVYYFLQPIYLNVSNSFGSWDLNRTIGWGWETPNSYLYWYLSNPIIFFLLLLQYVIYSLGYGLMRRYRPQFRSRLIVWHFVLTLFFTLLLSWMIWPTVGGLIGFLVLMILFVINMAKAFRSPQELPLDLEV